MTPALQQILHEITVRLTKLEETFAQPKNDCTRSHPHEEMSKECELRTEIARLRNQLAQRTWVGLTDEEIEMIVENKRAAHWEFVRAVELRIKEKNA